jgi:hypothetical protein
MSGEPVPHPPTVLYDREGNKVSPAALASAPVPPRPDEVSGSSFHTNEPSIAEAKPEDKSAK